MEENVTVNFTIKKDGKGFTVRHLIVFHSNKRFVESNAADFFIPKENGDTASLVIDTSKIG